MSFQLGGQQEAAVASTAAGAEGAGSSGGSVGPVIGVLAVIAVLAVAAGMAGRLCAGGRVFGLGRYDVEGWIDKKFGPCINGTVEEPPPPPPPPPSSPPQRAAAPAGGSGAVAVEIPTEITSQAEWQHAAEFSARRAAAGLPPAFQT